MQEQIWKKQCIILRHPLSWVTWFVERRGEKDMLYSFINMYVSCLISWSGIFCTSLQPWWDFSLFNESCKCHSRQSDQCVGKGIPQTQWHILMPRLFHLPGWAAVTNTWQLHQTCRRPVIGHWPWNWRGHWRLAKKGATGRPLAKPQKPEPEQGQEVAWERMDRVISCEECQSYWRPPSNLPGQLRSRWNKIRWKAKGWVM